MRDVGRKVRLASDSRSATYVLFFRVNFMELKLFELLSFGFSFGSWFGRGDVMQSERGLVAMFVAIKIWSKKRKDFCIESSVF